MIERIKLPVQWLYQILLLKGGYLERNCEDESVEDYMSGLEGAYISEAAEMSLTAPSMRGRLLDDPKDVYDVSEVLWLQNNKDIGLSRYRLHVLQRGVPEDIFLEYVRARNRDSASDRDLKFMELFITTDIPKDINSWADVRAKFNIGGTNGKND